MIIRTGGRRFRRPKDEAAYWYVVMQSPDPSEHLLKKWQEWVAVPENKQAFDDAEQLWEMLGKLPAPRWPTDAEVEADSYDGTVPIAAHEQRMRSGQQRNGRFGPALYALAAVIGTVAVGLSIAFTVLGSGASGDHRTAGMTVFETEAAQHDNVMLNDGSRIQMGARTAVTSSVNRDARVIVMDRGEALFEVAHDSKRPFRVLAGGGIITAVGTAFNVRRLDNLVVVTVTEGTVEVAPASAVTARDGGDFARAKRVTKGEEMSYDSHGNMSPIHKVDLGVAVAWRDGRLQYDSERLTYVIQDINRYSRKTVTVADAAAAELQYTGTVFERDIGDWIGALERVFPTLEVTEPDGTHVVIRTR